MKRVLDFWLTISQQLDRILKKWGTLFVVIILAVYIPNFNEIRVKITELWLPHYTPIAQKLFSRNRRFSSSKAICVVKTVISPCLISTGVTVQTLGTSNTSSWSYVMYRYTHMKSVINRCHRNRPNTVLPVPGKDLGGVAYTLIWRAIVSL